MTKENEDTETKTPLSKSALKDLLSFFQTKSSNNFSNNETSELNAESLIRVTKEFKEQATGKKKLYLNLDVIIVEDR